jgi:hypothetical protein
MLTLLNNDAERFNAFIAQAERDATTDALKAELERIKSIHNHNQIEGVAHLAGELGTFLVPLILTRVDKKNYGFPAFGRGSWSRVVFYVLLDFAAGLALAYVAGGLLTRAFSRRAPDGGRVARLYLKDRIFGRFEGNGGVAWNIVKGLLLVPGSAILDHYVYYYTLGEGKTEGGTFSGREDPATGNTIRYPGYPDRTSSLYKLPWEKGKVYQCAQGNQGIFSHAPVSGPDETYAFDFSLDNGNEVLAMRDGVVWDCDDSHPDGGDDLNFIIILHDAPPTPHDFDDGGHPVRTFSHYLHGKQDSIKTAFGGTLPSKESASPGSGTRVQQGKVIMRADDTGRSAYNHLHVMVKPDVNPTGTPRPARYTIPFVFIDPDVTGDKGVPHAFDWYESDNQKVP